MRLNDKSVHRALAWMHKSLEYTILHPSGAPGIVQVYERLGVVTNYHGDDFTMQVAAVLRDYIEFNHGTDANIDEAFGSRVVHIVKLLTEDHALSWRERKLRKAKLALTCNESVAGVLMADLIAKFTRMRREEKHYISYWKDGPASGKTAHIWYLQNVVLALSRNQGASFSLSPIGAEMLRELVSVFHAFSDNQIWVAEDRLVPGELTEAVITKELLSGDDQKIGNPLETNEIQPVVKETGAGVSKEADSLREALGCDDKLGNASGITETAEEGETADKSHAEGAGQITS